LIHLHKAKLLGSLAQVLNVSSFLNGR
jgi:hypothetical protein